MQDRRFESISACLRFLSLGTGKCGENDAVTCDFQQYGILTSVDSHQPVHHSFKLRSSKLCLVSSLTLIKYSSD